MPAFPFPWSNTANYPPAVGGVPAWGGRPTKVEPAYSYFTPGPNNAPGAQELNAILYDRDIAMATLATQGASMAVANWNEASSNPGGAVSQSVNVPTAACWDPFGMRWLLACSATYPSASPSLQATEDGGKSWFSFGPSLSNPTFAGFALASSPSTGTVVLAQGDGTTCSMRRTYLSSGSYHSADAAQGFLAAVNRGVLSFFLNKFVFVGSTGAGTSSYTGHAATSTDGSGAWTDASSSLPAGFASGSSEVSQYLAAQSATDLVVALCGTRPGTDPSRLLAVSAGGAMTDVTPGVLGGAAKVIRGLTYDVVNSLWGLLAQDASGNSYLWSSPDLATWTLLETFTAYWTAGLATVGGVWAVMAFDQTVDQGGNTVLYASTIGTTGPGSTWSAADTVDPPGSNLGSLVAPVHAFVSSGQQILRACLGGGGMATPFVSVACSLKQGFLGLALPGGGSGAPTTPGVNFEEAGVPVVTSLTANFIGATVTNVGGVARITIPSPPTNWELNGTLVVSSATLNVVGSNVSLSDAGGVATLAVTAAPALWTSVAAGTNFTPSGTQRKITFDCSGAQSTFNFPTPTGDGDSVTVQVDGTKAVAAPLLLASAGGDQFGDPQNQGIAVTISSMSTRGATQVWTYRLSDTTWLLDA